MTNTEAAELIRGAKKAFPPNARLAVALQKAITALEHQPEPQTDHEETPAEFMLKVKAVYNREREFADYIQQRALSMPRTSALECNVCHWRTLDTTRIVCDACGSHDLAMPQASDIGPPKECPRCSAGDPYNECPDPWHKAAQAREEEAQ